MNFSQLAIQNANAAGASVRIINSETGDDVAPSKALQAARRARTPAEFNRALRALPTETKTSQGAIVRYDKQHNGQELSKSTVSRMMNGGDKLVGTRPEQIRSFVTACGLGNESAVWVKLWQVFRDGKTPRSALAADPEELIRAAGTLASKGVSLWVLCSTLVFLTLSYREERKAGEPPSWALSLSLHHAVRGYGALWLVMQLLIRLGVWFRIKKLPEASKTPSIERLYTLLDPSAAARLREPKQTDQ